MSKTINNGANAAFASYREAVDWITGLTSLGIRPGLERMNRLLAKLDHPERRLKFIHVAGTNGKGSTCAYLARVLLQAGYQVGTFTSPYISSYRDRIQFNGQNIEEETLLAIVNEIKPHVDEMAETEFGPMTMFEVSTAIAIQYFARVVYPDFVVWETGLGGRLDVTNVVHPIVSVITNVGHDHMDILGDSLEKIAAEKAGIIKAGVPVISGAAQPEAVEVLKRTAAEKKATLYLLGEQFRYEPVRSQLDEQTFHFSGPFRAIRDVTITMNGAHQMTNASVALMTLEVLRQYYAAILEDEDLLEGMKRTQWAGRLEMIRREPALLIDGAHNPEGAESLASALRNTYRYEKLHLMMGMLSNKNHKDYLRHILPIVDTLIITEPDFRKKMNASDLADLAETILRDIGKEVIPIVEPDWKKALDRLTAVTKPGELGVVTGTLYLISDVRSWILHRSDSEKGW
jgi:dihydrofolate synthase/folylpolyglutamate synthase